MLKNNNENYRKWERERERKKVKQGDSYIDYTLVNYYFGKAENARRMSTYTDTHAQRHTCIYIYIYMRARQTGRQNTRARERERQRERERERERKGSARAEDFVQIREAKGERREEREKKRTTLFSRLPSTSRHASIFLPERRKKM
jgi:hypothetical protein